MGYSANNTLATSAAPAISEVDVSDIALYSAIISWKTNTVSTSTVSYGKTASYGKSVSDTSGSSVTTHIVKLDGLDHTSTYNFKITRSEEHTSELQSH